MAEDVALAVSNLYKDFRLPHERRDSIKERVLRFRRKSTFEVQHALKDINFEVKRGEFFGIVGRNGSGKSTLLKIIGGIYQPTSGKVTVNGTLTPFIELGIGFNPELTGRENVFLNGAILGLTRKEVSQKYDEIVQFAELEKFMDQKLKNYSSGMQVRLAFSVAIQAHNDILLIDEVLAVGDIAFQEKCFVEFNRIKKSGKTVIFISHDMGSVQRFCDRVLIINSGNMINIGPAQEMALEYGNLIADQQFEQQNQTVGTGKLKIKHVELWANNKKQKHIPENSPFTLRTYFEVMDKDMKDLVFGVSVVTGDNNVSVIAPNTKESGFKIDKLLNSGYIDATFENNPLAPNTYSVVAGFFSDNLTVTHDFGKNLLKFKVTGKARHGITNIEPRWLIKDKT